jgi:hypothetical protein
MMPLRLLHEIIAHIVSQVLHLSSPTYLLHPSFQAKPTKTSIMASTQVDIAGSQPVDITENQPVRKKRTLSEAHLKKDDPTIDGKKKVNISKIT